MANNLTHQFVEVTDGGLRRVCSSGGATCHEYIVVGATAYAGNTRVIVSPIQFLLANSAGVGYRPATARQVTRVAQQDNLLQTTELQPDDDTDFVSGKLVFVVPHGAGRFSLLWRGRHVATFVKTGRGKLSVTR